MRDLPRAVGRRIQRLRKAAGLTQQELADRMGGNFKYVGYIEQGRQNITLETIDRIARALGVEAYALFPTGPASGPDSPLLRDPAVRRALRRADPKARALALDLMERILRWSSARRA